MKQKSNFSLGIKYIGTHIIGIILSLIVSFSLIAVSDNGIYLAFVALFVMLTYWGIIGAPAYKLGYDDENRVKFNRMEKDLFRGFKIGAVAFIFSAVQIIVVILFKLGVIPDFFFVYKLLNSHLLIPMNWIENIAYVDQISWGELILMFSFQLVTPLFIGMHYIMGYKNVNFMEKIMYKNKKQNDPRKN